MKMKGTAYLVIGCVIFTNILTWDPQITIPQLLSTVINSYNLNDDFTKNFMDILSIICPESLFCEEDIPGVLEDATDMLLNATDLVSQSRRFLIQTFANYTNCCSRCKCTPDCQSKTNCCSKSIFNQNHDPKELFECVPSDMSFRFHGISKGPAFYMITTCNPTYSFSDTKGKCEKPDLNFPDEITPVHSESLGKIYFNIYCALCNFANATEQWHLRFIFNHYIPFDIIPTDPYTLYRSLLNNAGTGRANIVFSPRNPDQIRSLLEPCVPFIAVKDTCPEMNISASNNSVENFVNKACGHATFLHQRISVYNNIFCMLCTHNVVTPACTTEVYRQPPESLTALLDFNSNFATPSPQETKTYPCNCTEWFDQIQGICRPIICPLWERRIYCECNRWITTMSGMAIDIRITLRMLEGNRSALDDVIHKSSFIKQIIYTLNTFIGTFHFTAFANAGTYHCNSKSDNFLYIFSVLKNDIEFDMRDQVSLLYNILRSSKNPVLTVKKKTFAVSLGPIYEVQWTNPINNFQVNGNQTNCTYLGQWGGKKPMKVNNAVDRRFTKFLYCKQVEILPGDLSILVNVSAELRNVEEYFLPYIYDQKHSVMCLEDLVKFVQQISKANFFTSADTFKLAVLLLLCLTLSSI